MTYGKPLDRTPYGEARRRRNRRDANVLMVCGFGFVYCVYLILKEML